MERINKKFISKKGMDQEREKIAIRKANALMATTMGRSRSMPEKKIICTNRKPVGRVVIIPDGRENMATSTWKDKKNEGVDQPQQQTQQKQIQQQQQQHYQYPAESIEMRLEERVEDFKCELDRDRESWAKKQAMKLLKGAKNFA
ncbi:MAG: hypothetical protein SGILL_007957 [Bacillariaceae sp.]